MLATTSKNEIITSPYQNAKDAWDKRIGSARIQAHNWFLIAFVSLTLLFISLIGNVYLGTQSKVIPYVVELKPTGEANSLGTASSLSAQSHENAAKFFISRFIMLAREIPADAVLLKRNLEKVFQLVSVQGKTLLAGQFKDQSPAKEFQEKNRALKIASVLAVSSGVYQVDWFEAEYDKNGQKIAEYPMRGTFKIAWLKPQTEEQIQENPLGIFVDYFSWTKLGG
jgi:type IV secretory pathway TrbF-like protein